MNILFINRYHIQDIPGGGAEFAMDNYAKLLAKKGHKVSVVAYYMDDRKPLFENNGSYDMYRVRGIKDVFWLRLLGYIRVAKKVNPDIILMSSYSYSMYGMLIGKITGCKVGSFLHDNFDIYGFRKPFDMMFRINRVIAKKIDLLIADTKTIAELIKKETGNNSEVCYIGFDLPQHSIKTNYRKYSDNGEPFKFVYVGRMIKEKGIENLAEAFIIFKNKFQYTNSKCVFIGGGKYLDAFKNKYKEVDGIDIKGYLNEEDMLDELVSADVFVNATYLKEGIVLTNIQAMKLGVPVIATDTGSSSEAVTNLEDGVLIPPGDHHEIGPAMMFMATYSDSAERMAKNALISSVRFSSESSIERLEEILNDTVKN